MKYSCDLKVIFPIAVVWIFCYALFSINLFHPDVTLTAPRHANATVQQSLPLQQGPDHPEESFQQTLYALQNPKNCSTARKLVCSSDNNCGYACQVNHVTYCFLVAHTYNRTLVLKGIFKKYDRKGFDTFFNPVSNSCTPSVLPCKWSTDDNERKLLLRSNTTCVHLGGVQNGFPNFLPNRLGPKIRVPTKCPHVWWRGLFMENGIVLRKKWLEKIDKWRQEKGFNSSVAVGIHVRRGDKWYEHAYTPLANYMTYVDQYVQRSNLTKNDKILYLATDEPKVYDEAVAAKYTNRYKTINYQSFSKSRAQSSKEMLEMIIFDVEILSGCDYVVCGLSSNVCRLVYEKMVYRYGLDGARERFKGVESDFVYQSHRVPREFTRECEEPGVVLKKFVPIT